MFLYSKAAPSVRFRAASLLPWVFVLGVAAGTMVPARLWKTLISPSNASRSVAAGADADWSSAGNRETMSGRHRVAVLHTLDGDTFVARVSLWPNLDMTTRVRLRGIDAPEMKADCALERRLAESATAALRALLNDGDVAIFNIGPDKYSGRVVADVATRNTANVSDTMIRAGHGRAYAGGRRSGWCSVRG